MKQYLFILIPVILIISGMNSCQKGDFEIIETFNLEDHIGRYEFDIDLETFRDGVKNVSTHHSVGYVTKENDYTIKVLFDYSEPNINCVYEFLVRSDGSFYSTYKGAGDRSGQFIDGNIEFQEKIELGNGNFKHLKFIGVNFSKL
ncbi:hypothetical protein [Portibacter marinus]|uniref:hypothetical protein n=1 Tax=Portibacter marinus TaxID=2898660 RepID=UPI001F1ABC62|nr:hypothetical protein [Portibacter marinus]